MGSRDLTDSSFSECCTLPPVQAEYTPKGTYGTLNGIKTYEVGPTDTGKAVLFVYDVFGFSPQILQGEQQRARPASYSSPLPNHLADALGQVPT